MSILVTSSWGFSIDHSAVAPCMAPPPLDHNNDFYAENLFCCIPSFEIGAWVSLSSIPCTFCSREEFISWSHLVPLISERTSVQTANNSEKGWTYVFSLFVSCPFKDRCLFKSAYLLDKQTLGVPLCVFRHCRIECPPLPPQSQNLQCKVLDDSTGKILQQTQPQKDK